MNAATAVDAYRLYRSEKGNFMRETQKVVYDKDGISLTCYTCKRGVVQSPKALTPWSGWTHIGDNTTLCKFKEMTRYEKIGIVVGGFTIGWFLSELTAYLVRE